MEASEVWPRALVLTELFPPDVGGSAVLFSNIYTRLKGDVVVMSDLRPGVGVSSGGPSIHRVRIATKHWGLLHVDGLRHHLRLAAELRRRVRDNDTLVHCGRALPEGVAAWLAHFAGLRYVVWAHGEDIASALTSRELTWLSRRVYGSAEAVLANSRNTADMLARVGVAPSRIHIIYPGVDAMRFRPALDASRVRARYAGSDEMLILSVGRLQRRKGHDVAIHAAARLRQQGRRIKYLIVGEGEEGPRLKQLVAEAGLETTVSFVGAVSADDLPLYYAASDIFLLPNRIDNGDIEGFGIVFLEAASAGLPTVGGNSGGVPEAVEHGATGYLVDGANVDDVAAILRRLIDDPALRAHLGGAGRRRVLTSFTWERAAEQVARIQSAVLTESVSSSASTERDRRRKKSLPC